MKNINIEILYEDEDVLVINKPPGLIVHSDGRTKESTVTDWFVKNYPEAKDVGEPIILTSPQPLSLPRRGVDSRAASGGEVNRIERPGVVHRIDRETSGCLILAKTGEGHAAIKKQFQNREIEKTYHVFVYGNVKDDRGTINLPIGKSASDFRKWSAQRGARGDKREAVTYFEVLKRSPDKAWTFVEAKPKTGRTHQIRVHFQALQNPVVGDKLYASGKPDLLGFNRLALHARKIAFRNIDGERVEVEAPYPNDFQIALDILK